MSIYEADFAPIPAVAHRVFMPQAQREETVEPAPAAFLHPLLKIQRMYGNRSVLRSLGLARKEVAATEISPPLEQGIQNERGGGQALDTRVRTQMESAFGADFSKVRIHTGMKADWLNRLIQARAFTVGGDIFFRNGEYAPGQTAGRELLAHELTHVVQQNGGVHSKLTVSQPEDASEREADRVAKAVTQNERSAIQQPGTVNVNRQPAHSVQRRVSFDVIDWSALKLGPPALQNWTDPRLIAVPPTGQISISALVQVNGDAGDLCSQYEIGTTQTAWIAWTVAWYQGRTATDGSITVRHRSAMPMRDPAPGGDIWYDPNGGRNVQRVSACGDSVGIFHFDSPWHAIPKARNNSAVAGNPLNFLRGYSRGLHLVAYLTARDPGGRFLPTPLRFLYWNSIQDFQFTPNFASPLAMWAYSGQVRVNIGAKGRGVTGDAPYFITSGPHFNDHFVNGSNWEIVERP